MTETGLAVFVLVSFLLPALEDTDEIGVIVARHGMIITPQRGLIVQSNEK